MNLYNDKTWFAVPVAALLLFGSLVSGQTPPPEGRPMILNGFLSCGTGESKRECPARLHYVELVQGRTYLIRMESSDVATSLNLEDIFGQRLASDAEYNQLEGTIIFRPAQSGSFRLIATATNPKEGFYAIMIRELPVMINIESELNRSDAQASDAFERTYDVPLIAGRRYIIDMESAEFDPLVKLLNSDGTVVSFEDECGLTQATRIVFTPIETGVYRIVTTSQEAGATGTFRLVVCEE